VEISSNLHDALIKQRPMTYLLNLNASGVPA